MRCDNSRHGHHDLIAKHDGVTHPDSYLKALTPVQDGQTDRVVPHKPQLYFAKDIISATQFKNFDR